MHFPEWSVYPTLLEFRSPTTDAFFCHSRCHVTLFLICPTFLSIWHFLPLAWPASYAWPAVLLLQCAISSKILPLSFFYGLNQFFLKLESLYLSTNLYGSLWFVVRPGVCGDQGFDTHLTYVVQFVWPFRVMLYIFRETKRCLFP